MERTTLTSEIVAIARAIHAERYAGAQVTFLAGSVVRGEATSTSDLDLVVVYERLPTAYRESFRHSGWPVEAFVHDPETLNYFFLRVDARSGVPSLPNMVSEGIEIPESTKFSRSMKVMATSILSEGPPEWGQEQIDNARYMITGILDDLRDPRSRAERLASAAELYGALANYYLRRNRSWSASGKSIPSRLREVNPFLAKQFDECFDALFGTGKSTGVIELAEEMLAPDGGLLFDGYRSEAPSEWREPQDAGV